MNAVVLDNYLLSDDDVAKILDVPVVTVRRWRMRKQGPPYVKLGNAVYRYRREDLMAWLKSRPVGGDRSGEKSQD